LQLKFVAAPERCAHWPGLKATGQAVDYVGRDFVRGDKDKGLAASHPASKEPVKVDSDSEDGRRFVKLCRRGDLLAHDKATAEMCGVGFVELEHAIDGWVPKAVSGGKKDSK
jgi:hypothetical protein